MRESQHGRDAIPHLGREIFFSCALLSVPMKFHLCLASFAYKFVYCPCFMSENMDGFGIL